jgi:hypothetical protein
MNEISALEKPGATPTLTIETHADFESALLTGALPGDTSLRLPLLPGTDGDIVARFQKLVERGFRQFEMPFVLRDGWQEKDLKSLKKNLRRIFREYIRLKGSLRDLKVREFEEALAETAGKDSPGEGFQDCPVYSRELKTLADFYRPAFRRL